jgi:D-3-phosphoglycerate dehydrogenase
MSEYTVVITDHDFADLTIERDVLDGVAEVVALADDVGAVPDDADERLADADAVLNLRYDITADAIAGMDDCRIIARYGIGVDNIDVAAATERGIPVTNMPDYCSEEVASHALTLALALGRGLKRYDASVAAGDWDREVAAPIHRLSTRTVGVVGYGAIGREVGARFAALNADVLASDPFLEADDVDDDPATLTSFEDICDRADVVTVHSPLTEETRGMLDADAFARMDGSAVVINVARGPIVNVDDLYDALEAGEIRGAGLDVFPAEPPAADHPLRDHPNVITTPHVAWYSEEANDERRRRAAEIVRSVLTDGDPENVINDV